MQFPHCLSMWSEGLGFLCTTTRISWQPPYVGWLCMEEIWDVSACRFSQDVSGMIQWIMWGFFSSLCQTLSLTSPTKVVELLLIDLTSGTAPFWGNPIPYCREEFALKLSPCPVLSIHLALCECDKWKSNSPRPRKQLLSRACHSQTFAVFIVKLTGLHWTARLKAHKTPSSQMLLFSCRFVFLGNNTSELVEVGWSELVTTKVMCQKHHNPAELCCCSKKPKMDYSHRIITA